MQPAAGEIFAKMAFYQCEFESIFKKIYSKWNSKWNSMPLLKMKIGAKRGAPFKAGISAAIYVL